MYGRIMNLSSSTLSWEKEWATWESERERDGEWNNSVPRWYISVIKFTHWNFRGFMKISDQFTTPNMSLSAIVCIMHADGSRMEDTGQLSPFAYTLIYVIRIHSDSIKMINTLFVRDNIWFTPWLKWLLQHFAEMWQKSESFVRQHNGVTVHGALVRCIWKANTSAPIHERYGSIRGG